jgi:hypothetical protein
MAFIKDENGNLIRVPNDYVPPISSAAQPTPTSASSTANIQNPVDTSVPKEGQVNLKSSSTATQQAAKQAASAPAPTPKASAGQTQKTPTPQKSSFTFNLQGGTPAEAPLDTGPTLEQRQQLRDLANGTAETIAAGQEPQKWQTLYGWLRRNDPTLTPWTDFVLHGPRTSIAKSNQSDMEAARLEQDVLNRQRQMANSNGQLTMPQVRLRQQYQSQWDKLIGEWNSGRYAGDEQTEQAFYEEAERLLGAMQNAGMDTSLLHMPSINPGGFSQGYNKYLSEPLEKVRHLDSVMGQIYSKAANNPDWLLYDPEATTLFDKLGEYTILDLAKSKGTIADAEKVRIQIEMMDPSVRRAYDNIMMKFFDDNTGLQRLAQEYQLDLSTRKTLESLGRDLNGQNLGINSKPAGEEIGFQANVEKFFTKGTKQNRDLISAMGNVFNAMNRAGQDVPIQLMAAFEAMKEGKDAFMEYVMQDAPVNMSLIWNLAMRMRNESLDAYNDWTRKNGKMFGWKYRSAYNFPTNFGEELARLQETPEWLAAQAPIYKKRGVTAAGHIPGKTNLGIGKVNNGGGTR